MGNFHAARVLADSIVVDGNQIVFPVDSDKQQSPQVSIPPSTLVNSVANFAALSGIVIISLQQYTGHERESNHCQSAFSSAPCARLCYPPVG